MTGKTKQKPDTQNANAEAPVRNAPDVKPDH